MPASRDDRRTPLWFFQQCQERYGRFTVDVAANRKNHLTPYWLGPGSSACTNGLEGRWYCFRTDELAWCNPPYGPPGTIELWIAKAREQRYEYRTRSLLLLPADTSTHWYHDVTRTELTELVSFRLPFAAPDGSTKGNSAKFGSLLVYVAPLLARLHGRRRAA